MSITDDRAFHQGKECLEIAIPRDKSYCDVSVDPTLGFLPVKHVQWSGVGKRHADVEIEYVENDILGWVISRWVSNFYDGDGQVATSLSGTVESIAINEPISDDVFDIEFPVGTRIREELDGKAKYFIQEANGVRRETRASKLRGTRGR